MLSLSCSEEDGPGAPTRLRVLTFNVLVDVERPWEGRKDLCAQVVRDSGADLIGLQETSPNQYAFFLEQFPDFGSVGAVELTEADQAELVRLYPPVALLNLTAFTDAIILYRKEMFEKLDEGHWWQSPSPEKLSNGFGNIFPRIAVWARLKHLPTGGELLVANTHFDNTAPAQTHMAKLSHEKLNPFIDEGLTAIFTGDFNSSGQSDDYVLLTSNGWRDSYLACPESSESGRDNNVPSTVRGRGRIDHVFYQGSDLEPKEWRRLDSPDPETELSDHCPILAEFEWNREEQ
jgi:endonuclease/exonuclease/phosphatase family metal-dependent hydrolase